MGNARHGGVAERAEERAYPAAVDARGERPISPTDVSQYVRLDQCRRYLRLRLHERAAGSRFLYDYGVAPQAIPPLLSRSGLAFEADVTAAVRARFPAVDLAAGVDPAHRGNDNERVAALARDLPPGKTLVLLQPRLEVAIGGWRLRGDADLLRLERDPAGELRAMVADVKSSAAAKVEHRLQVAFYHEMLAALLAAEGVPCAAVETAVLYRGPAAAPASGTTPEDARREADQREAAERLFNAPDVLLELVEDPEACREEVRALVTGRDSVAARVAGAPFAEVPYHLTYKCDGCLYTEFCAKWSAEHDDLSLLPHLSDRDKNALRAAGLASVTDVAHLKQPRSPSNGDRPDPEELVPTPGTEELVRRLGATWPVGPRLDELIHRARRYRDWKGDKLPSLPYIPSMGYGSLPYSDAGHNPNLVRVFLDAQHDHLHDRVYLLGSRVVAAEHGRETPQRRRSIVHLADGPPLTPEAEAGLFTRWVAETIRAIVELAAPDEEGLPRAPIHLVFYDRYDQRVLLEGLGRHAGAVLGATPLYDFVTQLAAFDSPVATFLSEEIRELRNYPMVCQSLQAVAAYLKFDWNEGTAYRDLFRHRLFDFWAKRDEDGAPPKENRWYTGRARFSSQIPLEYAYAAWGELPPPPPRERDEAAPYRRATPELLRGFQARRLEAMAHVAGTFAGNKQTVKRAFDLPNLAAFEETAHGLAQALDEFVTIERHVDLAAWKRARLPAPERRAVAGETLIGRYEEADQEPGVAEQNREHVRRQRLSEERQAALDPSAPKPALSKAEKAETAWSPEGMRVALRLDLSDVDAALGEVLALSQLKPDDSVILSPRWETDSRLPPAERVPFQPTPRQMLYAARATLRAVRVEPDASGRPAAAFAELTLQGPRGYTDPRGFAFPAYPDPLVPGARYTLDKDPNDWYGSWQARVTEGLVAGERNTLHDRLADPTSARASWPAAAAAGQARFQAGLDALRDAGALHGFEESKHRYVGVHGDAPVLLVQGPPGTGKSYSTAFALFARLQGAMAADLDHRALLSCKTHAATDVLLENVLSARAKLTELRAAQPAIWAAFFDDRLLDVPLFRLRPKGNVADDVLPLRDKDQRPPGAPKMVDALAAERWCVAAATPGGVYAAVKERWPRALFGHDLVDCLVLDEASQMNLPEAAMAALPLKPEGRLVVVGDHRQMPPIVKHDWENEARRTFRAYRTYESLFTTLLPMGFPIIRFAESFRLHADIAAFLKREVYRRDGIDYHSKKFALLEPHAHGDGFLDAVLAPQHPLTVVVHDETASQHRNPVERALIAPVLEALAARGFDAAEGLGVVVPHRAQRALLQEAVPALVERDPATGAIVRSAVDTVERFQGGERTVILVGATESDPAYLLAAGEFLLDPRRLTVALSRAKQKMVLVAARSVFDLFSADEETFRNARLWKTLLRQTCTLPLWQGSVAGARVEVWANPENGRAEG